MKRIFAIILLCTALTGYSQDNDASIRGTAVRLTPRQTQNALISGVELVKTDANTVRLSFDIALPEEYVRRKEACVICPAIIPPAGDEIGLMPLAIAGETYYKVYSDDRKFDFIRYTGDSYLIRYSAEAKGDFDKYQPGYAIRSYRSRVGDDRRERRNVIPMTTLVDAEPVARKGAPAAAPAASLPVHKLVRFEFGQDPEYDSRGFSPSDRSYIEAVVERIEDIQGNHKSVINKISIFSSGAPFGDESENKEMTLDRISIVREKILSRCPSVAGVITEESVPENWAEFRSLVESSGFPNKESVLSDIDCIKNVQLRKIALRKQPNYPDILVLMKQARKCVVEIDYTEMQKEKQL